MTGTYPGFAGIKHVLTHWDDDTYLDPREFNSFANQLKEVGYATAIAGKWNLSWLQRNDTVKAFGFDEYCLWQMYDRNGVKRSRYYQPYFRMNGSIVEESIAERFGPDVLTDFMINFMKRKKTGPSWSITQRCWFILPTSESPVVRRRVLCPIQSKRMVRSVFPRWSSIWTRTSAGS